MLSIAHASVGAYLATKITNPLLSIPLILASHYALDAVYHHDAGTGLSRGTKTRQTALILGIVDLLATAVFVLLLYPHSDLRFWEQGFWRQPQVWGSLLGLLPDVLEAPRNFLKYEPKWLQPINRFHGSFHHSTPIILAGLAPQAILLTLLWLYR